VSGEAGLGKSRLADLVASAATTDSRRSTVLGFSPMFQQTALHPVIDELRRELDVRGGMSTEAVEKLLAERGVGVPEEAVPLLAQLLGLPPTERYARVVGSALRIKQRTHAVLADYLCAPESGASAMIFEDLHSADPTSLELIAAVAARAEETRTLLVLTWRPEFRPPGSSAEDWTRIELEKLDAQAVRKLARERAGGKALPRRVLDHVVEKSDGIPLFVEEIVKAVLDSEVLVEESDHYVESTVLDPAAIPDSLQTSLMARIDRLGTAKAVAQLASIIGRTFSFELLEAIAPGDAEALRADLARLTEAGIIERDGSAAEETHRFRHALIQETAYRLLLRRSREDHHRTLAERIEARAPGGRAARPELLAHHYASANLPDKAIPHLVAAGTAAARQSAHIEACGHLGRALELLMGLPDRTGWEPTELGLRLSLGASLIATNGYSAPEVELHYNRACEICEALGNPPEAIRPLLGLSSFYFVRCELDRARSIAESCLERMDGASVARKIATHHGLGAVLSCQGNYRASTDHYEQGLAFYDGSRRHHAVQDDGIGSLVSLAWNHHAMGRMREAFERCDDALARAHALGHPFTLSHALNWASAFRLSVGQIDLAREHGEEAIAVAAEEGFQHWVAMGNVSAGAARVVAGDREGAQAIRRGLEGWRASGAVNLVSYFTAQLARAHGLAGDYDEALAQLLQALSTMDERGERWFEAEARRWRGRMLHESGISSEAAVETAFEHARQVARSQGTALFELRALLDLDRHARLHGREDTQRDAIAALLPRIDAGDEFEEMRLARERVG
jgi:predicted ATPase